MERSKVRFAKNKNSRTNVNDSEIKTANDAYSNDNNKPIDLGAVLVNDESRQSQAQQVSLADSRNTEASNIRATKKHRQTTFNQ